MRKKTVLILVGAVAPIIFILFLIGVVCAVFTESSTACQAAISDAGGNGTLSESVLAYEDIVGRYCAEYGISEYAPLVLAVMQQESGGAGSDPMQCSECPDNLNYPDKPNGITDPNYSVEVGVEYLASCIRAAGCTSPSDIPHISLALQGYNYGGGYIEWAEERGGYSAENAMQFSQLQAVAHGWPGYGDPQYVSHVLRYYYVSADGSTFIAPLKSGTYSISRGWGYDGGEFHKGIDFAAPAGTDIYAAASGMVVYAQFGVTTYDGYGNVIVIRHDDTYSTLYGHCSRLLVKAGQTVQQGQVIALVGTTGHSTGNHCHFEIRVNGNQVDPAPYLSLTKK